MSLHEQVDSSVQEVKIRSCASQDDKAESKQLHAVAGGTSEMEAAVMMVNLGTSISFSNSESRNIDRDSPPRMINIRDIVNGECSLSPELIQIKDRGATLSFIPGSERRGSSEERGAHSNDEELCNESGNSLCIETGSQESEIIIPVTVASDPREFYERSDEKQNGRHSPAKGRGESDTKGSWSSESETAAAAATTTLEYTTSIELPDTKEGIEELCPVCGDKVSGYHYGLLTCESCKGFFKRTVQNKKVYTCVGDRSCQIDKTQRKRCPYCRFQKCLDVGMKLEAVRADRMRGGRNKFGPMYKRDRARKLQIMRQRQITHPNMTMTSRGLTGSPSIGITYSSPFASNSPIKEEIQSPFLSSSTSSPDSSPAPMQICGGLLPGAIGTATIAIGAPVGSNQGQAFIGGQDLSLWVGNAAACPPSTVAGAAPNANGNGQGTANGNSRPPTAPSENRNNAVANQAPSMIRQLVNQVDDQEWQQSLYSLLQNQTYNQCEVDLFELLCKVLDQNLFSQVDWARNSYFFKDLRVDDQMKLLQHSWSDLLILDHLHQRIHNKLQDEMSLPNGQKFDLLSLALLGTTQFADRFHHIMEKLSELKFDVSDYICLKFILLLNPDIRSLNDRRSVVLAHEQVKQTLIDYCITMYPEEQERYQRMIDLLPELHYIADNGERFLYFKHTHGAAPSQTLLMEMLHTRRR